MDTWAKRFRIVCVYVPHCGYARQCTEQVYGDLSMLVHEAKNLNRATIIGEDFSTSMNFGPRGQLLRSFATEHHFDITNWNAETPWDSSWTFRSSLGHKQQLDYILTDMSLDVVSSHATEELDCGSDHRAVKACMRLTAHSQERSKRKRQTKWRETSTFEIAVSAVLQETRVHSLHDIHDVVKTAFQSATGVEQPDCHDNVKLVTGSNHCGRPSEPLASPKQEDYCRSRSLQKHGEH